MLRWLKRLLGLGAAARAPLLQMNEDDEAGLQRRLWVLRDLDGRDLYASLDEETSARLRARQAASRMRREHADDAPTA